MKVRIVIFDGVDEMDLVAPLEIFRAASRLRPDIDVATLETPREVKGAFGLRVVPDGTLDHGADLLTVPGGEYIGRAPQGARAQIAEGKLRREMAELNRRGAIVAGVCTGGMILSAAGVPDGRAAVTHRDARDFGQVVQARVVGMMVTSSLAAA
jgi:putative intracellular protease/amidase